MSNQTRHRVATATVIAVILILLIGLTVYLVTRPNPVVQKLSQTVGKFGAYQGIKQTVNGSPILQTSNGNYLLKGQLATLVGITDGTTITVNGYLLQYPQSVNGINGEINIVSIQIQV